MFVLTPGACAALSPRTMNTGNLGAVLNYLYYTEINHKLMVKLVHSNIRRANPSLYGAISIYSDQSIPRS